MAAIVVQARLHIDFTTSRGDSLWMRDLGLHVADIQNGLDLRQSQRQSRRGADDRGAYNPFGCRLDLECVTMDQEHTP